MAKAEVNRLTNANVYVNGNSFLGKAEEVMAPTVKHKLSEHKALGLVGSFELWAGIDKMEMKIKWNSFYKDVWKVIADPTKAISIQIRGSLETYTSQGRTAEVPIVIYCTAFAKDLPFGNFKQHDNVELETNFTVTAVKQEIDGEVVSEIDVLANIYKVNGVDILQAYRANTGT